MVGEKNLSNPILLETQNISFKREDSVLIQQVTLSIACGELVAIIGPNGTGKSTLMRLLSGYLVPTEGDCKLLGKSLSRWDPQELALARAVMRQQSNLPFPFSVREVIEMGRSPSKNRRGLLSKNDGCFRVATEHGDHVLKEIMEETECDQLADRDYRTLSGGEQQRVQLARALAQIWQPHNPPCLLLLDEPTSALDLYHQQHALRLLYKMTRDKAMGVCCILHDLNLAALYADRILLLCHGRLVAAGPPEEVLNPEHLVHCYCADLDVRSHPHYHCPQIFLKR